MVPNIILIAVLINFSGFFTKTAIDISNVTAYELYKQIGGQENILTLGIGGRFIGALGLTSQAVSVEESDRAKFNAQNPTQKGGGEMGFLAIMVSALGDALRLLITAWVLFAAAIMIFIRALVLIILYISKINL